MSLRDRHGVSRTEVTALSVAAGVVVPGRLSAAAALRVAIGVGPV